MFRSSSGAASRRSITIYSQRVVSSTKDEKMKTFRETRRARQVSVGVYFCRMQIGWLEESMLC
jgi:hypothetical protein